MLGQPRAIKVTKPDKENRALPMPRGRVCRWWELEQGSTQGTHLGAQGPAWALPRQDW